ncbi:MAG: hypothetical protein D6680_05125 [Cyanobacteria bacterium J007]|nr:MAG: hypothetical protein D6680_05125 [Cyanobacteria bacterium J007]
MLDSPQLRKAIGTDFPTVIEGERRLEMGFLSHDALILGYFPDPNGDRFANSILKSQLVE